jgi:hypothetical protein
MKKLKSLCFKLVKQTVPYKNKLLLVVIITHQNRTN